MEAEAMRLEPEINFFEPEPEAESRIKILGKEKRKKKISKIVDRMLAKKRAENSATP